MEDRIAEESFELFLEDRFFTAGLFDTILLRSLYSLKIRKKEIRYKYRGQSTRHYQVSKNVEW